VVNQTPSEIEDRIRDRILKRHPSILRSIVDVAGAVASDWEAESIDDRSAAVDALEQELENRDVLQRIPGMIHDLASAVGLSLAAPPVAAPPYVTVTGAGVVIRITCSTLRIVITVQLFCIGRNPTQYRLFEGVIRDRLTVEVRQRP
jgi:hypothetical protein